MQSFNLAQALAQLNLDVPSFRPVARAFVQDVTECLEEMERATALRDLEVVARSAQALHRVARVIHADGLVRLAVQLEGVAQTGAIDELPSSLAALRAENNDVTEILREITDDK